MTVTTTSQRSVRTATRPRLYTPGPVEIPIRVLRALSAVPPHHRTQVFKDTVIRVTGKLKGLHQTEGEVFILASSGTGAMEASIVNIMGPGEKAMAIVGGKFGERWKDLLEVYDVPRNIVDIEWGTTLKPAELARRLDADKDVKVVYATYSDTSTGTLYDIRAFAEVTRKRGVRLVVDAITGVGVHELKQDEWGVDVVVCGSQKGLMVPPGLATISIAPFAKDIIDGPKLPRFYFDLQKYRRDAPTGQTPWTPAVSLILALEEALDMISEEGLDNVVDRHMRLAKATQAGGKAAGYRLFSKVPAHSCTAFYPPEGMDAGEIVKRMREVHRMIVAGGQGELKGKILRVGHMGEYDLHDIVAVVSALEDCATELGGKPGGAARAARKAWLAA